MEDALSIDVRNTPGAGVFDYGDGGGPLLGVARQLRWDLMRLSDLPPAEGRADRFINGFPAPSGSLSSEEALRYGICDSTKLASQLAAADEVCRLTLNQARHLKPGAIARLMVGKVRILVEITEDGLFVRVSAEFRWVDDATAA